VPSAAAAEAARRRSSFARLRFDRAACTVTPDAGTRLDTDAFGKGDAVDRLRALPEAASGDGWLLDLGGQVAVGGTPPEPGGWLVAVASAGARDRPAFEIRLTRGSLATSAGSERDLIVAGQRIGHILDARTGKPAAFAGSVTVWHDLGLAADALSTALYVMGPQAGIPWADARGVAACFQVPVGSRAGRYTLVPTRAFTSRFPAGCQPAAPVARNAYDDRFLISPQVSMLFP
jgi:thiamine biosynthesis lipoprotein